MKKKIKVILAIFISSVLSLNAVVFDLPKTNVAGEEYYYYKVKPKETIYSLSRELGVTQEEMIKYNPTLVDGLKADMMLYFPVKEYNQLDAPIYHVVKKGESLYGISKQYGILIDDLVRLNPSANEGIKVGEKLVIKAQKKNAQETIVIDEILDDNEVDQSVEVDPLITFEPEIQEQPLKIALLMPFMLNEEQMSGATRIYLDFYKGFILAADSLKTTGHKVNIYAYDTNNSIDSLEVLLSQPEFKNMNVIIVPPGMSNVVARIANHHNASEAQIFNVYYANDTTHLTHSNVIQANINSDKMSEKAISWLVTNYTDYIPVVFGSPANMNKASFAEDIKRKYKEQGVESKTIIYKRSLLATDLQSLNSKLNYIFIPLSSSENELKKSIDTLKEFKKRSKGQVALFGYPEWIISKDAMRENLHELNTTIYSRFYFNENGNKEKQISQKFIDTYKQPMKMSPPIQAVLGFDCGLYLIKALREGDGIVRDANLKHMGLQYTFDFSKNKDCKGLENSDIYIVNFREDNKVESVLY